MLSLREVPSISCDCDKYASKRAVIAVRASEMLLLRSDRRYCLVFDESTPQTPRGRHSNARALHLPSLRYKRRITLTQPFHLVTLFDLILTLAFA